MLKVKKKIQKTNNKNQNDELKKIQDDLKNSIKGLFISDQKNKKTIDQYAQLTTKIREEYAKFQQEFNQLKIQLTKYKQYVENLPQQRPYTLYRKPIRKRKHYHDIEQEESDESDSYVTEIRRRPKKQKRKRSYYEDELDGLPDYEPKSPSEEEQDENEIEVKKKFNQNQKSKKRNYKINKNVIFCNFS